MATTHSAVPITVFSQQRVDKDAFELEAFFDLNAMDSTPSVPTSSTVQQSRSSSITSPASTVVNFDQGDDLQTPAKPSHEYDQYKQQTGLPSGSMPGLTGPTQSSFESQFGFDNIGMVGDGFGSMTADPSMEFDTTPSDLQSFLSPNSQSQSLFDDFVDPSDILAVEEQPEPNLRFFPGMHSQQAQAKPEAQRKQAQQQQMMAQQRQQHQTSQRQQEQVQRRSHQARKSASHITDARTEETIARVVHQIRQNSSNNDDDSSNGSVLPHIIRAKKDEEEMDEDERLLASEEGKKLSSKERRQLRNKVSARAFRSRRKEYIGQLEGEVAAKNNECIELRNQNRALTEENARSQAFIEKLLRHPAFHPFLEDLSRDANLTESLSRSPMPTGEHSMATTPAQPTVTPHRPQPQQQLQSIPEADRKPQVGMVLMPEQQPDISMLNLNSQNDAWPMNGMDFNFNTPRVYAVLDLPENPVDIEALTGKGNTESFAREPVEETKVDYPTLETSPTVTRPTAAEPEETVEESDCSDIENDPTFALYVSSPKSTGTTKDAETFEPVFGAIQADKALAHIELFVSSEPQDQTGIFERLESLYARADAPYQRIQGLLAEYEQ